MEENAQPELPTQIELKKKLIVCPKCKAEIEVDLTIDITPITDFIGALGKMNNQDLEDKEQDDGN